ncbi:MAG: cation diffusion facilitator family transporter [Candidatus Hydrogenedentes bacterium]|nr:cation diffusion facilitator family transporter [Candidatus Hydrogenedentota bacterium]
MKQTPNQNISEVYKITWIGLFLNLFLTSLKVVVGYMSNSKALIADGVHSLSDCVTDFAILLGGRYWFAPADEEHPHGHGRLELLVTVFIGIVLGFVGLLLSYKAILPIVSREIPDINSLPVISVAFLSFVSKEWLYRYTVKVGKRVHSSALIANAWHHRSDSLSSLPVLIAGIAVLIDPVYRVLDPVATVIIGVFIMYSAVVLVLPALNHLIDRGVSKEEINEIRDLAISMDGVKDVHAIRSRHIGGGISVDLHLLVEPCLSVKEGHTIAGKVKNKILREKENIVDVLIHVEPYEETQDPRYRT